MSQPAPVRRRLSVAVQVGAPFVKKLGWAASGDLGGKVALLVTTVVAARAMPPEQFGRFIAFTALAVVAAGVWDFGLSTLATRAVAGGMLGIPQALRDLFRHRATLLPLWLGVFVGGAALTTGRPFTSDVVPYAICSAIFATHTIGTSVLRGQLRFAQAAGAWTAGRVVAAVTFVVVVALSGHLDTARAGWLLAVGEAATMLVAFGLLSHAEDMRTVVAHRLRLRDSLPLAANGIFSLAYNRLDVVILPALASAAQLARYAPATRLQDALYVLPFAFSTVGLPVMADRFRSGGIESARRVALAFSACACALSVPALIGVFVVAPFLVEHLFGAGYDGAIGPIRVIVFFLPFSAATAPLLSYLIATDRSGTTSKVFAVSFAISLILHLLLDPKFGATGGSIATLARDVFALPLTLYFVWREGFRLRRGVAAGHAPMLADGS